MRSRRICSSRLIRSKSTSVESAATSEAIGFLTSVASHTRRDLPDPIATLRTGQRPSPGCGGRGGGHIPPWPVDKDFSGRSARGCLLHRPAECRDDQFLHPSHPRPSRLTRTFSGSPGDGRFSSRILPTIPPLSGQPTRSVDRRAEGLPDGDRDCSDNDDQIGVRHQA